MILFIIAYILLLPLTVINFFFVDNKSGYFKSTGINIDKFANREFRSMWNATLIIKNGYQFGNELETLSSALGKNQRNKTLTAFGKALVWILDKIEKDHCKNSIKIMKTTDYNFSLTKGTYVPLNGTVWQSGKQLNADAYSDEIPLPNTFSIAGDVYNTIRIYSNGFITFGYGLNNGQIMGETVKSPISNTVKGWACDYVVSAFGGNLCAAIVGTPEISYGLNATNDFVIQFQNMAINNYNQTRLNFQIVLKSNNSIQFIYGDNLTSQASAVSPQVGLRGKAELVNNIYVYNDWNNRKLITGSWNVLEANSNLPNNSKGTMPSSAMAWKDTTILPQSGLTFNWTI